MTGIEAIQEMCRNPGVRYGYTNRSVGELVYAFDGERFVGIHSNGEELGTHFDNEDLLSKSWCCLEDNSAVDRALAQRLEDRAKAVREQGIPVDLSMEEVDNEAFARGIEYAAQIIREEADHG